MWRYGGMEVRRCGGMEVWRCESMEVWKYGGMEVWRYGGLEVWRYVLSEEEKSSFLKDSILSIHTNVRHAPQRHALQPGITSRTGGPPQYFPAANLCVSEWG